MTSSARAGPAPPLPLSPSHHHIHRPPPPHASACTSAPSRDACAHAELAAPVPTTARTQGPFPRWRCTCAVRVRRPCRAPCLRRALARVCSASRSRSSSFRYSRMLFEFGQGWLRLSFRDDDYYDDDLSYLGLCITFISVAWFFFFESSSYPTFITSFLLNPHCIYTIICSFLSASLFEYSSLHSTIVLWRRRGRPANYTLVAPTPTVHMYARCIVTHSLIIITSSSPHCLKRPIHRQSEPKDSGEEEELKPS